MTGSDAMRRGADPRVLEFEPLYTEFVRVMGSPCSRREFWWCMVDARKRGLVGATRRRSRLPGTND